MAKAKIYDILSQTEDWVPPRAMYDLAVRRTQGMRHRMIFDERITIIKAMASAYMQGMNDAITAFDKMEKKNDQTS